MMTPAPGERLLRFVGDRLCFNLTNRERRPAPGWRGRLRTDLGRADALGGEIISAHARGLPFGGASWRDLPMKETPEGWSIDVPLAQTGYFKAKAYLLDPKGWQHWPAGPDVGIAVHPNSCRTANTIYCAFPRMFGKTKGALNTVNQKLEGQIEQLERDGYSVIPPSGKLRDLVQCLPHIIDRLGCRILHLLPVNPTPTTYARFGRFGSPYAALDLTAIDPALVVFDKRTTGVDQFRELTSATHRRGARVFLDIVINHTGWGSTLQENHPRWFLRDATGAFVSPGAWGTIWEDLVELKHDNVALWDKLAEMFLVWCCRGVDGFRCDAGYKVPVAAWQYIIARVRREYPETIFLLEGLGGPWETTEALLTEGGMQWAYSELFQNYSGSEVAAYLDYAIRQSGRVGLYTHYSETHDNDRLAAKGRAWSLLRNRLCALTSVSGGFGFTCGVEWLATEKIRVHGSTGMAWDNRDNLVPELARLNELLALHPCFFDGAILTRLSAAHSPVYALLRQSAEGKDTVLVLVNTSVEKPDSIMLTEPAVPIPDFRFELLGQPLPEMKRVNAGTMIQLPAGAVYCLSLSPQPLGLSGDAYRRSRAQAAWALQAMNEILATREIGPYDWRKLADFVERSPSDFLAAIPCLDRAAAATDLIAALDSALSRAAYPRVVTWNLADRRRITPVPPGHWLLIEDSAPFRASLQGKSKDLPRNVESIPWRDGHVACFPPRHPAARELPLDATLSLERYAETDPHIEAAIRFLGPAPAAFSQRSPFDADALILLTNGIGGMARIGVDLGRVQSKYDCVLGANLHPSLPVDRHILVKRLRAWVNADGFISPLNAESLVDFSAGPRPQWTFHVNAGDGRLVVVKLIASMLSGRNAIAFQFSALRGSRNDDLKPAARSHSELDVRLTVRFDIEDRNFHAETHRNGGAEHHITSRTRTLPDALGFAFTPAEDRRLFVFADRGVYHPAPEWSENVPHPREQSRGQPGSGDAFSPGWFEVPMPDNVAAEFIVSATSDDFDSHRANVSQAAADALAAGTLESQLPAERKSDSDPFEEHLTARSQDFIVRRGRGKTVIAGYPWFLDWGRDTFICARGLLAAGWVEEVRDILVTFARFEKNGTLPNTIHGDDVSNRDTSDAPLWFGIVCEELAAAVGKELYGVRVDDTGRTIGQVLASICWSYLAGTFNGIRMDPDSGLIWSPGHFTWMDTNHPAGTPREGYPVEIQALWIRLLRQLARIGEAPPEGSCEELASRALASLEKLFWLEDRGCYADVLIARPGEPAGRATASDALRSNCLFPVSLELVDGERAQRCVNAALRFLVVPGALRSLAPLPVSVPLPVHGNDGRLLNHPSNPYWGRYEGDEDTRRKPAYHNGTAWTWTFPVFCEALARAWEFSPEAVAAARSYLGSMDRIMAEGCIGHVPEILDGDAPHSQRGCDAQAWGVTEALRVWKLLKR